MRCRKSIEWVGRCGIRVGEKEEVREEREKRERDERVFIYFEKVDDEGEEEDEDEDKYWLRRVRPCCILGWTP
jgi:hypothetical protein